MSALLEEALSIGRALGEGPVVAFALRYLSALANARQASEQLPGTIRDIQSLLGEGPVALTRAHRAGHVTASTMIVGADGRVLLLRPTPGARGSDDDRRRNLGRLCVDQDADHRFPR